MVHLPTRDETIAQSIAGLEALESRFPGSQIAAASLDLRRIMETDRQEKAQPGQTPAGMWAAFPLVGAGAGIWKGLVWYEIVGVAALAAIAAAIIFLAVSTARRSKRNRAVEKLARSASDQGYKTAEFQCLGDYRLCCKSDDSRLCVALFALCICKQIVPLMPGSKK